MRTDKFFLYRIIHRGNLKILFEENEIKSRKFSSNKNYISIGEKELISLRGTKEIPIKPFGAIEEYVSFYFGLRSPMLYCIKNGYSGAIKRPMKEIIYLVTSIETLQDYKCDFVFTDGHAYTELSAFYNNLTDLENIDWKTVQSTSWSDTQNDPDKKRRKQAECLIHKKLSLETIKTIAVFNKECSDYIREILKENNSQIPIIIKPEWYY